MNPVFLFNFWMIKNKNLKYQKLPKIIWRSPPVTVFSLCNRESLFQCYFKNSIDSINLAVVIQPRMKFRIITGEIFLWIVSLTQWNSLLHFTSSIYYHLSSISSSSLCPIVQFHELLNRRNTITSKYAAIRALSLTFFLPLKLSWCNCILYFKFN